ncbi:ABC transporter permease/substrate-binding protein [Baaleninema sp.]|uniref:ABC transporter permease/substrate-binding protein n=1 Tax=Baaleninema sp. TaxID=3101197 RepID=UPI003D053A7F
MSFGQFLLDHQLELADQTIEHIGLTTVSLAIAISLGVSVGIILTRYPNISDRVIGAVGIVQTIPSVALLGFMLPLLGIGVTPAIVALFLYALLPIVRNTYTGIDEVDSAIKEAAKGMGMSNFQILLKVELPLAVPVIFAGIRTAAVTTVGVATLCALIASGGLGEFIFRGIALNNVDMILAGAIPAALLALLLDFLLGVLQSRVMEWLKPLLVGAVVLLLLSLSWLVVPNLFGSSFTAGFTAEFMERADGYPGLRQHYGLKLNTLELEPGLMYKAIREKQVDLISGFSTDGRIQAYNLTVLEDNLNYFPPYYAAPLVRGETLREFPEVRSALNRLAGQISNEEMVQLNYRVDRQQEPTMQVVREFLSELGLKTETQREGNADLVVGSKNFTEQYLLAEMMAVVIENYTNLDVELKTGLAGTKIAFDALRQGEIDLYPEYTGTGLLAILNTDADVREELLSESESAADTVLEYVREKTQEEYNLIWLEPFGFNNSYALMMREAAANELDVQSISDLKAYLSEDL